MFLLFNQLCDAGSDGSHGRGQTDKGEKNHGAKAIGDVFGPASLSDVPTAVLRLFPGGGMTVVRVQLAARLPSQKPRFLQTCTAFVVRTIVFLTAPKLFD